MSAQPPLPAPDPKRALRNVFLDWDGYQRGPDGSCHLFVSTKPIRSGISGHGLLFAIKSGEEPLTITSFGFHVNPPDVTNGGTVDYEVHALKEDGYYAHPERSESVTGMISPNVAAVDTYDYRWDLNAWSPIANGSIVEANLTNSTTILKSTAADFFVIPPTFRVNVPGNGGIKSFIIATRQRSSQAGSFIYVEPAKDANIYDKLELTVGKDDKHAPEILAGEGIADWPLPTTGLMYQMKSFVGKVYYEEACPSPSPSLSTTPSADPTLAASGGPSVSPTATAVPSGAPSTVPSHVPSLLPSQAPSIHIELLLDGLLVSLAMVCDPGDQLSEEEGIAMSETVQSFADARKNDFTYNIQVETKNMACVSFPGRRHLLANRTRFNELVARHRNLPTSSSAMDFSLVITGEYRPMSRPGQTAPRKPPDLGIVAEDSINRDPEGFIKDLKDRASLSSPRSPLQQVEASDISVRAVEVSADQLDQVFTREPTPAPTPSPTVYKEDNTNAILLVCIVITSGIIVLLAALLIFRCGQRRAARAQRENMVRIQEQRAKARSESRKKNWEENNSQYAASGGVDKGRGYLPHPEDSLYLDSAVSNPPLYRDLPQPDLQRNSKGYSYGYGGQTPPPPALGQPHGAVNSQSHHYPPMQPKGLNHDPGAGRGQPSARQHPSRMYNSNHGIG